MLDRPTAAGAAGALYISGGMDNRDGYNLFTTTYTDYLPPPAVVTTPNQRRERVGRAGRPGHGT